MAKDVFSLLAVYTSSPYLPRSPIRTRYHLAVSSSPSGYPSPRYPTTGSTFPSLRHDSVSVSSIFSSFSVPRTFEHQRVHRRYHNRRSPGDVTGVGAPPCERKRERKRKMENGGKERSSLSPISLSERVLFSLSSPSLFLYSPRIPLLRSFCGPSLSPLSLCFLAFARACRKTPNRSVTQRKESPRSEIVPRGDKERHSKISRSSILTADRVGSAVEGLVHGIAIRQRIQRSSASRLEPISSSERERTVAPRLLESWFGFNEMNSGCTTGEDREILELTRERRDESEGGARND